MTGRDVGIELRRVVESKRRFLSDRERQFLIALSHHVDADGHAFLKHSTLAAEVEPRVSVSTIGRAAADVRRRGWVWWRPYVHPWAGRGGRLACNEFWLTGSLRELVGLEPATAESITGRSSADAHFITGRSSAEREPTESPPVTDQRDRPVERPAIAQSITGRSEAAAPAGDRQEEEEELFSEKAVGPRAVAHYAAPAVLSDPPAKSGGGAIEETRPRRELPDDFEPPAWDAQERRWSRPFVSVDDYLWLLRETDPAPGRERQRERERRRAAQAAANGADPGPKSA